MKTVHTPEMVAHLFAHQTQDHARNSGDTFYFLGNELFSYGSHFCIAKHVENKKGEKALLFTTRSYSNTTYKHVNKAHHATNHLNKIYCAYPDKDHAANLKYFYEDTKGSLKGLVNARKPEKYIDAAESILRRCETYCSFFGIKVPKELIKLLESAKTGEYSEYLAKESKRIERERIKDEKKAKKEYEARAIKELYEFRKFERSTMFARFNDRDHLRYNSETKRIETSQRIEIPLAIAKMAYAWLKQTISKGGCSGECNYKILNFEVTSVTPELFIIGCHKIDMTEIEMIAKQLNWE